MVSSGASLVFLLLSFSQVTPRLPQWELVESGTKASLRGLDVVDAKTIWASGQNASFLVSRDGGESFEVGQVKAAGDLDFRDVHGFDGQEALLLGAGKSLYRTEDGGQDWQRVYHDDRPGVFFDAMAFVDEKQGWAFSDPVEGKLLVLRTEDGGKSWIPLNPAKLPDPNGSEAGFAASGTCLAVSAGGQVWIGLGGDGARVFRGNASQSWRAFSTPMLQGSSSRGIFSLAFHDEVHGVAVGGDYREPKNKEAVAIRTDDGGETWKLVSQGPAGYRSCVTYVPGTDGRLLLCVGPEGSDISFDGGEIWTPFSDTGYHAVAFGSSLDSGWASGSEGRLARCLFPAE